jgi:hypothetical protein
MDSKELFKAIDARITSQSNITRQNLARALNVDLEIIEQTVREVIGTSFREHLKSKRLAHALKVLEDKRNGSMLQTHGIQRAERRVTIPGATVSYLVHGRRIRKSDFSISYPLYDVSRGGIAFLADYPLRPGRVLSLLIGCAEISETLRLVGIVVYAVAENIAGYQYRLGVCFRPFEAKNDSNPPKSMQILSQLVSLASSYSAGDSEHGLTRVND